MRRERWGDAGVRECNGLTRSTESLTGNSIKTTAWSRFAAQ
jgi:hypothetical protein